VRYRDEDGIETVGIAWTLSQPWFVPAAAINAFRRDAVAAREAAQLSCLAKVYSEKARAFDVSAFEHRSRDERCAAPRMKEFRAARFLVVFLQPRGAHFTA
jgi:hypothetical protein